MHLYKKYLKSYKYAKTLSLILCIASICIFLSDLIANIVDKVNFSQFLQPFGWLIASMGFWLVFKCLEYINENF